MEGVAAKYEPRVDGADPTHVFIIEYDRQPIGWIQWYRWADYSEHARQLGASADDAGIDLSIGELGFIGKGFGSKAIRKFVMEVISQDAGVKAVVADPEEKNLRSIRAFEKAGFSCMANVQLQAEHCRRKVMRIELS